MLTNIDFDGEVIRNFFVIIVKGKVKTNRVERHFRTKCDNSNSDLQGYEQSTDKTPKARWKLAYISALDGLTVLCDSRT